MGTYILDGYSLTVADVAKMLSDEHPQVKISDEARARREKSRGQIDEWLKEGAPTIYGINTGLGALKDVPVPPDKHIEWNKTLPYVHGAGFGDFLPAEVTRAELLLRANILCRAFSAVRVSLIERLLDMFNNGISPAVHGDGSTGLSDLAPIAQNIMTVAGLPGARAIVDGKVVPAAEAYRAKGMAETFTLECKEVLAQMNGSTMSQSIAVVSFIRFQRLFENYRKAAAGKADRDKLAACEETVEFIRGILDFENNITCDNPNLFELEDGTFEAVMGCNCSNTQVGYVMDLLSVILAEMGWDVAELFGETPRVSALLDKLRGMTMQVSADSIPTKGGQEDHVEFSYSAARKADAGIELFAELMAVYKLTD
ncbi:aromatic amino acid ammonia-lyase [Cloacibacillus evryensis]|uniref:aromatic amino acid ammonia-lyase n=1 Tax=Cloacibacillus evryensis TaxID=508460 RepID=UPI002670DD2B|nr:aromatic amino acid ammonia-lyase [Cloacibacillus evryensis]